MVESYVLLVDRLQEELDYTRFRMHQLLDEKMHIEQIEPLEPNDPNEELFKRAIGGITPPSIRRGQLRRRHAQIARARRREQEQIEHPPADIPADDDSSGTEIPEDIIPRNATIVSNE